jgi:hypothetical protein
VKGQIDLTEADSVRKSQATSDIQKTAQDLLKNTFTSEPDKQLLNSDLAKIIEAKTEKSVNSAVKALNATISDTQKHNKPAADKAKADRQAAEAAQTVQAQAASAANINNTAANKWAIENGYNWHNRKGHSTVIPPGGSLPPGYHWQVP